MKLSEQLRELIEEIEELENLTNDERVDQALAKLPETLTEVLKRETISGLSRKHNVNRNTLSDNRNKIIRYNNQLYKRIS